MAIVEIKPFLVTFSGSLFGYWLLDPPDDASPLVKKYMKYLLKSCDLLLLANSFELTAIVDEAICAIQDYKQPQQIRIGSQCNRLMKHAQVSAVYFFHYEAVGIAVVKYLHEVMKWLFECRPPRKETGKELLSMITKVTASATENAETRLYHLKKSEDVLSEEFQNILQNRPSLRQQSFMSSHIQSFLASNGISPEADTSDPSTYSSVEEPDDIQAIRIFSEMITKSSIFWQCLVEHFRTLKQLANEILATAVKEQTVEEFEDLKRKVIQVSTGWIAVRRISTKYIKHVSPQLKKFAETTVPHNLKRLDGFNEFACTVNVHFDDLQSLLMTKDLEMQNEVAIYSTWVKPTMNVSVSKCLETVDEVTQLVKLGRVREVSRKFSEVTQYSRRIRTFTEIYIRRLEAIEIYAVRQQEKLMKKMEGLENDRKVKNKEIQTKNESLAMTQQQVMHCEKLKAKAEENKNEAQTKKREAENRQAEVKKWWWVPIWGQVLCIRELIEDNSSKINAERDRIDGYNSECSNLQSTIQSAECQISNLRSDVSQLSSQIDDLKDESQKRIEMLREMKEATATLKKSVYHWNEFMATIEHGETRSGAMQKIALKATKIKDPTRVLCSGGTQTTMKSFTEAFQKAEHILNTQWQYMVSYEYKCELCGNERSGLPLPVNEDTVVCNECAHRHIE